jgi:hypothetical protein
MELQRLIRGMIVPALALALLAVHVPARPTILDQSGGCLPRCSCVSERSNTCTAQHKLSKALRNGFQAVT